MMGVTHHGRETAMFAHVDISVGARAMPTNLILVVVERGEGRSVKAVT